VLQELVRVVRVQQHKAGAAATIIMLLVIARLTLFPSGPGPLPSGFHTCLLCGSFGLADFIDNIILFVPLGFALRLAGVRRWTAWLFMAALAAGIETAQDWLISGRESALGDLVSNAMGGAIGIVLADGRSALLAPAAAQARRLASAWAIALIALAAFIAWTYRLAIPPTGKYWTQVASRLPQYVPFEGTILGAALDGVPVTNGRLDTASTTALRTALRAGHAEVEARIVPSERADRLAPLVTVYDQWRNEILVLGCRQGHAVLRARTHTWTLLLHPISYQAEGGCAVDDTTTVIAEPLGSGARVRFTLDARGRRTVAIQGAGLWRGWHLLVPNDGWWSDLESPFTILWMVALLAPLAYWSARGDRAQGRSGVSTEFVALTLAVLVATLAVIPRIAGSTVAPLDAWSAGAVGAVGGWICAQWRA
jgi:VanZ family protein